MTEISIAYDGELRCRATHGASGATVTTDAAAEHGGHGEYCSPTDLVAVGLGSCVLTIVGMVARRHGVDITGATAVVKKEMATGPVRRIGRLDVTVRVPGVADEALRRRIERAVRTCPVHHSLHPDIAAPIGFEWLP
jgi:putative redox protein